MAKGTAAANRTPPPLLQSADAERPCNLAGGPRFHRAATTGAFLECLCHPERTPLRRRHAHGYKTLSSCSTLHISSAFHSTANPPAAGNMSQSNGVPPTVLQRAPPTNAPRGAPRKPTPLRLKVLIRRLPPGLTEVEFYSTVGEEWRTGAGKVDWANYEAGKISKE
jgi:hypothetical protein